MDTVIKQRRLFVVKQVGTNRARWRCGDCGHRWTGVIVKKKGPRIVGDVMIAKFARYWGENTCGCMGRCPKCSNDRRLQHFKV